jgi:hypothetical protein
MQHPELHIDFIPYISKYKHVQFVLIHKYIGYVCFVLKVRGNGHETQPAQLLVHTGIYSHSSDKQAK